MEMIADRIRVIDTDSHVTEPPDVWTDDAPKAWRELVPRVEVHPETGIRTWLIGDVWDKPEGESSFAGSKVYPPLPPRNLDHEDIDPGAWNPEVRLRRMDEYGIYAQILYPNLLAFSAPTFLELGEDVALWCVQRWNDWLTEFANTDPARLIPTTMVPFWDVDATVTEIVRCREMGHRGILFCNRFERIGLPAFWQQHWDPVYTVAEEAGLPINFHVGFAPPGGWSAFREMGIFDEDPRVMARANTIVQMGNAETIAIALTSGLCDRFPNIKLVSVESGFGYVPYLLESLDWHWYGHGAHVGYPTPPSEAFRRNCYGSFWFEKGTLCMLEQYPDNFMFETDYPHQTSLVPGPASPADIPSHHIEQQFANISEDVTQKVLHDNAVRIFQLAD